jgi:Family of unknown function (DUF6328)
MPDETDKERVDRELIELLNEIRVALPGVQVLFAFLLILPFQQGFADITDADRAVYTVALLASALAAAVLIAPSMYHRLNFRRGKKETMLFDANKLMIVGMLATAVGVTCAVYLVTDVIYGETPALVATFAVAITFAVFWIGLPLVRRGDPEA